MATIGFLKHVIGDLRRDEGGFVLRKDGKRMALVHQRDAAPFRDRGPGALYRGSMNPNAFATNRSWALAAFGNYARLASFAARAPARECGLGWRRRVWLVLPRHASIAAR